jgi:hypothetical protein
MLLDEPGRERAPRATLDTLLNSELFSDLVRQWRSKGFEMPAESEALALFRGRAFRDGDPIMRAGDKAVVLLLENGTVAVMDENEQPEHISQRGAVIGALEAFYGVPMRSSVLAKSAGFAWEVDLAAARRWFGDARMNGLVEKAILREAMKRDAKKPPVLFFPGFASTQLFSWKRKECPGMDIDINGLVWIDSRHIFKDAVFGGDCWLKCMALRDVVDELDPEDCVLRPSEGLHAIYELAPGVVTAGITAIFRNVVETLASQFHYNANNFLAVPYDWRLSPLRLESRDSFFSGLKMRIELLVAVNARQPAIAVAHSMGNNVFIYFCEWLKHHFPDTHIDWLDKHVSTMIAVGAPLLGAAESGRAAVSGLNFGLPISDARVREMGVTFGSSLWMFPVWPRRAPADDASALPSAPCAHEECAIEDHVWALPVVNVTLCPEYREAMERSARSAEFAPQTSADGATSQAHSSSQAPQFLTVPVPELLRDGLSLLSNLVNGFGFNSTASSRDSTFEMLHRALRQQYVQNPISNPLSERGPGRPPVRHIVTIYGVNLPTDVAYRYVQKPLSPTARQLGLRGEFSLALDEIVAEVSGGQLQRRTVDGTVIRDATLSLPRKNGHAKSGDGTVPYTSLSWAHTWHVSQHVNITRIQTSADKESFLERLSPALSKLLSRDSMPDYSIFESMAEVGGRTLETTVMELDGVLHRDIVKDVSFVQLLEDHLLVSAKRRFFNSLAPVHSAMATGRAASRDDL